MMQLLSVPMVILFLLCNFLSISVWASDQEEDLSSLSDDEDGFLSPEQQKAIEIIEQQKRDQQNAQFQMQNKDIVHLNSCQIKSVSATGGKSFSTDVDVSEKNADPTKTHPSLKRPLSDGEEPPKKYPKNEGPSPYVDDYPQPIDYELGSPTYLSDSPLSMGKDNKKKYDYPDSQPSSEKIPREIHLGKSDFSLDNLSDAVLLSIKNGTTKVLPFDEDFDANVDAVCETAKDVRDFLRNHINESAKYKTSSRSDVANPLKALLENTIPNGAGLFDDLVPELQLCPVAAIKHLGLEDKFAPPKFFDVLPHIGLRNSGSDCFVIAFLQALLRSKKFAQLIFEKIDSPLDELARELAYFMSGYADKDKLPSIYNSENCAPLFRYVSTNAMDVIDMQTGSQDVYEYARKLLATLFSEEERNNATSKLLDTFAVGLGIKKEIDQHLTSKIAENEARVLTRSVEYNKATKEPALSVTYIGGSVQSSLNHYFRPEQMLLEHWVIRNARNEKNEVIFRDIVGKDKVDGARQDFFVDLGAPVLILSFRAHTLEEFQSDPTNLRFKKNHQPLKFTFEIDMGPYEKSALKTGIVKENKYALWAIIVHNGEINSGHYWTFVEDAQSKNWFMYNDSFVDIITSDKMEEFANKGFYSMVDGDKSGGIPSMLFYQKVDH